MIAHFANNLHLIEKGLRLFTESGGTGIEHPLFDNYPGTSPRMDIFAIAKNNDLVVIECKVDHGHPAALGQLAGYAQWIRETFPNNGKRVRAILLCKKVSPMVWYAAKQLPEIKFSAYRYTKGKRLVKVREPKTVPITGLSGQYILRI